MLSILIDNAIKISPSGLKLNFNFENYSILKINNYQGLFEINYTKQQYLKMCNRVWVENF